MSEADPDDDDLDADDEREELDDLADDEVDDADEVEEAEAAEADRLSAATRAAHLVQEFTVHAATVAEQALATIPQGTPAWDAALVAVGVRPPTAEARLAVIATGIPQFRGALPHELRQALETLRRRMRRAASGANTDDVDAASDDDADTTMRAHIADLVATHLLRCRPPVGLGAIFANAQMTTQRMTDDGERMIALRCPCCGAARPADAGLRVCGYCGHELFPGAS
jgi:hypothetical protein